MNSEVVIPSNPHDRLFKEVFSNVENAVSELKYLLPSEVVEQVDWSTLKLEPGEYIDESLRARQSDLLFSVSLRSDRFRNVLLHVLFEHQSSCPEKFFPLRLLVYEVRILEDYVKNHPEAEFLPVVIPVVLYHGKGKWTLSRQFSSLYDPSVLSSALSKYVPTFEYVLDNVQCSDEHTLKSRDVRAHVKSALWFLKSAREGKKILEEFRSWLSVYRSLLEDSGGEDAFLTLMRYYFYVTREVDMEEMVKSVRPLLGEQSEVKMKTLAEKLMDKGRLEGEARGEARALYTMFEARGWSLDAQDRHRIERCTDVPTLESWVRKAVLAHSVDEVFS